MVDEIMLFLLRSDGHRALVRMTTTEIGAALDMSQQNVSRRLVLLEKQGKVERKKGGVELTEKGINEIRVLLAMLQNSFDSKLQISGTIADGLGEGGFYISRPGYTKGIRKNFNFDPYPGTLNIKLDEKGVELRRRMIQLEPRIIAGFRDKGRMFGDLFAYSALVDRIECAVVVPIRTHHGQEIIELVAPVNLRERMRKKTGDEATVRIL